MSDIAKKYGIARPEPDKAQAQQFERDSGINFALSQALYNAEKTKAEKKALKAQKKKQFFDNIKQFAMDEMISKIPFSGLIKSVVKMPSANDAIDSLIDIGTDVLDSARTKISGDNTPKYTPKVPATKFLTELPSESIGVPSYEYGGPIKKYYDDGGNIPMDPEDEPGLKGLLGTMTGVAPLSGWMLELQNKYGMTPEEKGRYQRDIKGTLHDLKYGNIMKDEKPGSEEMGKAQEEIDELERLKNMERRMTQFVMGRYAQPGNFPQYGHGGKLMGPSHEEGGIPIEVEGGEYIMPSGYDPEYEPLLEAMRNQTLASKMNK